MIGLDYQTEQSNNLKDLFVSYSPINLGIIQEEPQIEQTVPDRWQAFKNVMELLKASRVPEIKEEKTKEDYLPNIIYKEEKPVAVVPQTVEFSLENPIFKEDKYTSPKIEGIKSKSKVRFFDFQKKFDNWIKDNDITKGEYDFLTSFAALESAYDQGARSKYSSASGWFQLTKDNGKILVERLF